MKRYPNCNQTYMVRTSSKILLTGSIIVLFAGSLMTVKAQTTSDKPVSLVNRVVNLMREIPKEALPPPAGIKLDPVRPGLFSESSPIFEVASPDKQTAVGTIDGSLYVRQISNAEKSIIAKPISNWRWDVEGALWSPDGKMLAVRMIDDSDVPRIPIVNWLGRHEEVSMLPYARAGEKIARQQLYIVNAASGNATAIQHGEDDPYFHILDWDDDSHTLYFLRADRLTRRLDLLAANAGSGKVKPLFTETNKFGAMWWNMLQGYDAQMSNANLVRILGNGNFIWTSEKSGFAHLYLYERNGQLIRPLTEGRKAGFVRRLIDVDEKRGYVYVVMQGTDDDDLYEQTLYRFRLSDGQAQKLTEFPSSRITFSKDMEKLWVVRTGLRAILDVEELNNDGSNRKIIWSPDLSFFKDYGFSPEFVKTLAADGKTELRSLILKPKGFDSKKSYPVIEYIYGGPNANIISDSLPSEPLLLQEVANRGFIIVLTDGRGTQRRGQTFQNYAAGRFGQVEIADHAAVIRQLGKERSYIDISRVGICGLSWGGYFTLRALIQEPELYKAGVLMSPSVDVSSMRVAVEPYMGCLPVDCPAAYKAGDNTSVINKLKAPVLIIIGTADNDVPNAESVKLVGALQKAGKDHELILLPGLYHNVLASPIPLPKLADFFERHLARVPETR
jgi:dipeptidyl aminopeptidase/acylaminoacyl peptidase